VAGQNIVVNQLGSSCSYALRSPSATIPSTGGPTSVGVITAVTCPWTAVSNAPSWIHITSGSSSNGPGDVGFTIDPNPPGSPERTGTATIASLIFSITQAAAACTITLTSTAYSAGETGGSSSFTYTTSTSGCPHTVQSYTSWIHVTSANYAGTSGAVNFSIDANTYGVIRSGIIKVGDRNFTVNQAASSCAYTLSNFAAMFSRTGGDGAIPVSFSPTFCGPPPVLVNGPPGMVGLTSVTPASGTYTQNYSVSLYQSVINFVRTAQVIVSGQIFTVKQTSW
jgi:hypothetical protein